jgi:hypothetical protein
MKTRIENSQRSVPRDRRLSSRTIRTFLEPDLVVTDLHMPGLDGAEVTRRLKQRLNYFFAHFPRQQVRLDGHTRFLLRLDDEFVLIYDPQADRPVEPVRKTIVEAAQRITESINL